MKPRVAHVLHSMKVAGAEVLVHRLISRYSDEYDFHVFVLDDIGALGEELKGMGIPVTHLKRRPGVDIGMVLRLRKCLTSARVDLVHAHQYTPWFYATLAGAARVRRRPRVLFTEHGRHYPDSRRWKRILFNRVLLRATDMVVAVSGFVARCLEENEALPSSRVRIVYNGIDPARFGGAQTKVEAVRQSQGLDPDDRVVGLAARMDTVKDHQTLLRAFAALADRVPQVRLVLAGEGPLRPELECLARSLGVKERVRFLGVRRDIPMLMATWDVFALSSLSEGTSVTLLEAMASRLPVVATDVGGNPEIVEDGMTGRLVPRGGVQEMAEALEAVLLNPDLAKRYGAAGRTRVQERFTEASMMSAYQGIYRDLLKEGAQ